MRYITIGEALGVYERVMAATGGLVGIRDLGALESAIAQPYMTFDGNELYPSLAEKAAAQGFLVTNGYEINASTDEQVEVILSVASGKLSRDKFTAWLSNHIQELS